MAAVAVEAVMRPKVVEADLGLGPVAMLAVEPDAVVAEPMVVVVVILAGLAEPKEVVLGVFVGVAASTVVGAESVSVMAVPMEPGDAAASVGLEVDSKLVVFAAYLAAHESAPKVAGPVAETVFALEAGPRVAEHVSELVAALEADSRMAGFEGSNC